MTAPKGLGPAGRRFHREVLRDFELTSAELVLLAAASRQIDEIVRLDEALQAAPTLVDGSTGQVRVHPLFSEVRQHRAALARLLSALGLREADAEADEGPFTARSAAGRRLALVRHHGSASGRVG